jgi:TRAP-type mannitol/chloroaromatic compound transport system substrate-binding protein
MRKWFAGIAALVLGVTVGLAASSEAEAKKVRWKVHAAFGKNLAVIGQPPHRVSKAVARMSGGDLDLKVFEPGALVGGYAYYDAVGQGAIDAAWGTPGANQGKNSAYNFFSTWPFGPAAPEFMAWLKYGGGIELAEEFYARDGIKYLLCGMIPPETAGWFRTEITSLDQLRGLKMRFFGLGAKVVQKFGVSTQQLAAADIYPALELGTIDATEFSMPAIDRSLGFYQIAKFNYFPGWHQQSTANELLVNMENWNKLSEEHQAMLETACLAQVTEMIADGESSQFKAMLENEKNGVKNLYWQPEMLNKFEAAWNEVIAEETAGNPDSKRVWESISAFREKYAIWRKFGYLK